ncbi:MAG: HAMP domain-containing histidine kinase [Chitinophagaceae bacterium]|nr:HAMP domain-containing histidine kinase [Chitinophagaceae bacterium]
MSGNLNKSFFRRKGLLLIAGLFLLGVAFFVKDYWSTGANPNAIHKPVQKSLNLREAAVSNLMSDSSLLNAITSGNYSEKTLNTLTDEDYYLFAYKRNSENQLSAVFWSTQHAIPDEEILNEPKTAGFKLLANGWFVFSKKDYTSPAGKSYLIVSLIPIKWNYYIENNYLHNQFAGVNTAADVSDISLTGGLPIYSNSGKVLFYLEKKAGVNVFRVNLPALALAALALLFILYFIHLLTLQVTNRYGFGKGILTLTATLLTFRLLTYFINPFNFRSLKLFNPSVYGKNFMMGSLGDLLVNLLLLIWIILFFRFKWKPEATAEKIQKSSAKFIIALAIALLMCLITFASGYIIKSLVADPQISFDVINFFSLNIYSLVGFLVLCCVSAGYFMLIQRLAEALKKVGSGYYRFIYIAVAGLLLLTINPGEQVTFQLFLLLWLLLFAVLLDVSRLHMSSIRLSSSGFIFWITFFSVSITAVIAYQNHQKELEAQKDFARNLSEKVDPSGPLIMNIIRNDFSNEYMSAIFHRFKNPAESLLLKDSIIRESFSAYLNKYSTEIYTFDSSGNPLNNLRSTTFNDLNTIIETQGRTTGVPGLYYYDVSFSNFNYISRTEITDSTGAPDGYIFIVSKPRNFESEALYPELFSRGNKNAIESSPEYAYAIYIDNKLIASYNDYPFATDIDSNLVEYTGFRQVYKNGNDELWYSAQKGKVVMLAHKDRLMLEVVTLFAYLFCSFLIVIFLFNLAGYLLSERSSKEDRKPFLQPTIRNQVHGTIILISVFSFLVIGVSTILFFINRFHNNNREFLSRTIHLMENELHNTLDSSMSQAMTKKTLGQAELEKLSELIRNVSNIHATDINLYDTAGNLKVSSLPLPYEKGIVSEKMDPVAWYHMSVLKDAQYFKEQSIGSLHYLSNYLTVRDQNGEEYAYLNIPYFESQKKLQDEISNLLVAIINLNAFIFIIAGIISLFIANRITRPFSLISDRMRALNLQTGNEEISWKRNDEIGDLVKEYNRMVKQLDISAQKLARSEREGAWREMARQVAHEIKNPLTPMKLNLQYLQMAIEKDSPDVKNISAYVAEIILNQIEHLSQIASDFSQFANLANTNMQDIDLNDALRNVISLYATNERIAIESDLEEGLTIHADKTQINRLFTNLLQNAVQSVPDFRNIKIEIKSVAEDGNAIVSLKDNGVGIPPDMGSKIFVPNFTTKSSGTGLGLAICKGIVEKINGDIRFETKEGEWTTFYVKIPLVKK